MTDSIPKGYLRNCAIKQRPGDDEWIFYADPKRETVIARLDGYAVVPVEDLDAKDALINDLVAAGNMCVLAWDKDGDPDQYLFERGVEAMRKALDCAKEAGY